MYKDNVAKKLITVARVVAWLGIVLTVLTGVFMFAVTLMNGLARENLAYAVALIVLGPLCSWLGGLLIATIGHMADDTRRIREKMCGKDE